VVRCLSALLSDHGFTVSAAQDSGEALTKARAERPDLITLDITVPGKSGVDVFTTLRRDPELGLFTANKVAEKHHGCIDVESRPGEGTRFTVRIPRAMSAQPDSVISPGSQQSPEDARSRAGDPPFARADG